MLVACLARFTAVADATAVHVRLVLVLDAVPAARLHNHCYFRPTESISRILSADVSAVHDKHEGIVTKTSKAVIVIVLLSSTH
jgi:hypothetical protein